MKKGFTLIELLAVIVILAVIALIAVPLIINVIDKAKRGAYDVECSNVEKAAEYYLLEDYNIDDIPKYKEYYIPVNKLKPYINKFKDRMLNNYVIIKKTDDNIKYYYTGRDKNPYNKGKTLKEVVENDTVHIIKNVKVNGINVNKVIGTKAEKRVIKNWVWYSGQLWQVLETTDSYIKLIAANSVTGITYGTTSDWSASWVRKWLNEIDSNSDQDGIYYNNLSRTDLLLNGQFCLDEPTNVVEEPYTIGGQNRTKVTAFTPINTCSNIATDKVGLMTFEDYVYSLNGTNGITGALGNSYIDEDEIVWTMTKYTLDESTNKTWHTYSRNPSQIEHEWYKTTEYAKGVRPVIYLSPNLKVVESNTNDYGTIYNPYRLIGEQTSKSKDLLNEVTLGSYIYLSEINNPYPTTTETVTSRLNYNSDKTKVRYRVIGITENGNIKVERTDVLRNLPSDISISSNMYIPYYYKQDTCDYTVAVYTDCIDHNYFKPDEGSGNYAYNESENIAYYLNNADNSFYKWLGEDVKANMVKANWNLSVTLSSIEYSYSIFNTNYSGTYPTRTNDGMVSAYVGLPQWGDIFGGNDLNVSYWYINRWSKSTSTASRMYHFGYANSAAAPYHSVAVRPVLILKNDIKIDSGEGTPANPYMLSFE